jgi:hypothetical protein
METFDFRPAAFIPFRDTAAIERVRRIRKEDMTRHPNPDFRITIMPASEMDEYANEDGVIAADIEPHWDKGC